MVMPDGSVWHIYALSFESDGMTYCFNIMATSAYHASLMLEDLKNTATLDGEIIEVIDND